MPLFRAAIVAEFSPAIEDDIRAIETLAAAADLRIIAVAQVIDEHARVRIERRLGPLENVRVLALGLRLGRGAAVRFGLRDVAEPIVAIVNLDHGIDTEAIDRLLVPLETDVALDGLLAFRPKRSAGSRGYGALAKALFRLDTADVQAPAKLFRTEALQNVLGDLQLHNHGFDADLMYRCRKRGLRIAEVALQSAGALSRASAPPIGIALRAVTSLFVLRLLESRFGRNPIVTRVGRPHVLAQKASYAILILCWRDPRSPKAGGGEVYLHEQARSWVRQGHTVTWVSQSYAGSAAEDTLDGIRIVRRGRSLLVFPAVAFWYVFRSGWRFDFILDVMNGIPFFTPVYSGKPKACLVHHVHAHHFEQELPRPLSDLAVAVETKLVPWIYRRTQFLTVSESSAREMVERGITRLPLEIIHNGVAETLHPGPKHPRPTILFLGRLRRYKGVRKLIDSFATIRKTMPDARLVIAGTGDDEELLRTYAAAVEGVEFTGAIDDATKVRLYQEAWVFGMPSTLEGWGIVVIEAASCGTPSVAYDVNGLRDSVLAGLTGDLVTTDAEFTRALEEMLADGDRRARLSRNCVRWAACFSWDRTAAQTLQQIRLAQPWNAVFAPSEDDPLRVAIPADLEPAPADAFSRA